MFLIEKRKWYLIYIFQSFVFNESIKKYKYITTLKLDTSCSHNI